MILTVKRKTQLSRKSLAEIERLLQQFQLEDDVKSYVEGLIARETSKGRLMCDQSWERGGLYDLISSLDGKDIFVAHLIEVFEKQHGKCALSGQSLTFGHNASLDRIDSKKYYCLGNVQWVDKDINQIKRGYSVSKFKEMCRKVTEHDE